MQKYVNITPHGIERVLRGQNFSEKSLYKSISEYIWNGFDASATKINVDFSVNQMGKINSLSIKDNGFGIDVGALDLKFGPFYDSEKFVDVGERNHSMPHGRKGIGRLTFFAFAGLAEWNTIFKSKGSKNKKYVITMQSNNLRNYDISPKVEETKDNSGTVVKFSRFFNETRDNFDSDGLEKYLGLEFGWWLELNKDSPFEIIVNKKKLDYKKLVNETKELEIKLNDSIVCELKYVQWKEKIHDEFSKFYYISSKGEEQYKENTTLNNKGDEFYHSVFIKSTLFDNFSFLPLEDTSQTNLTKNRNSEEFKLLRETVDNFLRKKRKPFLKETSYKLIEELEKDGVIPKETSNEIETIKKEDLENVLKGIYEIQPKVFSQLNLEQRKPWSVFLI